MSSLCESRLGVRGSKESIKEFRDFVQEYGDVITCDRFIPYPNEGCEKWGIKHWGTWPDVKWQILETEEDGRLEYSFSSNVTPIIPVVKQAGEKFPCLTFEYRYWSLPMKYNGMLVMDGGEITGEFLEYSRMPFWFFKRLNGHINWTMSRQIGINGKVSDGEIPYEIWDLVEKQ